MEKENSTSVHVPSLCSRSTQVCPSGYQCVNLINELGQITNSAICYPCNEYQYCPAGTFGSFHTFSTAHICPDGYKCTPEYKICSEGYLCKKNQFLDCIEYQDMIRYEHQLGSIVYGSYCEAGSTVMTSCEAGYYCPDPSKKIICPRGYYCPAKTSDYSQFRCRACADGSSRYKVSNTFEMALLIGLAVCCLVIYRLTRYQRSKPMKTKFNLLKEFIIQKHANCEDMRQLEKVTVEGRRHKQLLFLRDDLETIFIDMIANNVINSGTFCGEALADILKFDTSTFFDEVSGQKPFMNIQQLKLALSFSGDRFHRFLILFNKISGTCCTESSVISKAEFEFAFLDALEHLKKLEPTPNDVVKLFEELDQDRQGYVSLSALFHSHIETFLDKHQRRILIRLFHENNCLMKSDVAKIGGIKSKPDDKVEQGICSKASFEVSSEESISIVSQNSEHSQISFSDQSMKGMSIAKQTFVNEYARLLKVLIDDQPFRRERSISTALTEEDTQEVESSLSTFEIVFDGLCAELGRGPSKSVILDNISGKLKSGQMVAVMGSSGCGKTTLLHILSQRSKEYKVRGHIHVNGRDKRCLNKTNVGFVPQDDIVYNELTVRENLLFSGRFRCPRQTTDLNHSELADNVIRKMSLDRIADSIVGGPERRGISGGERKRVSIGMELMARPLLLFCDEPTSGLDSMSAALVMNAIKKLVNEEGMTVISSIHQPRKSIFSMFDRLFLLGAGGKLIYHGAIEDAETYFNTIGFKRPFDENLADWIVDISSSLHSNRLNMTNETTIEMVHSSNSTKGDIFYYIWSKWDGFITLMKDIQSRSYENIHFYDDAVNTSQQLIVHLRRNVLFSVRNCRAKLFDVMIIISSTVVTALIYGPVQLVDGEEREVVTIEASSDIDASTNLIFNSIYMQSNDSFILLQFFFLQISVTVSLLAALSTAKTLSHHRVQLQWEFESGYSIMAYFFAINATVFFDNVIQCIVASCLTYWLRGSLITLISYVVHFVLLGWLASSWTVLLAVILPNHNLPVITCCLLAFSSLCLCGLLNPITYGFIYSNSEISLMSGIFSPTRFFIESMIVGEYRCLSSQYGYVVDSDANGISFESTIFYQRGMGLWDSEHLKHQSCTGWFWGVFPSVMVGLSLRCTGLIILLYRNKDPWRYILRICDWRNRPKASLIIDIILLAISASGISYLYYVTFEVLTSSQFHFHRL